jgi:tetratricopeptide (TPR) repeat protein
MQQYMYSGKVMVSGPVLAEGIKVIAKCMGTKSSPGGVYSAYTDYKGNFSLTFGQSQRLPLDASVDSFDPMTQSTNGTMQMMNCDLTASAAGFVSSQMTVQFRSSLDMQEFGKLVLTPMGGGDDFGGIISVTTLSAPDNARKEFSKGLSDMKDKKFDKAEKHLLKATEEYPNFAIAWHKLGLIQADNNQRPQAQESFEKAIVADPKFVPPYLDLSTLIAQKGKWDEVASLSTRAIAADSTHFPEAYFLNGVANLNAGHTDAAEKSALRAQELDSKNTNPRVQLLLAEIYERTGRRDEAAIHFKKFLSLDPQSRDAEQVRARLAKLNVSAAAK